MVQGCHGQPVSAMGGKLTLAKRRRDPLPPRHFQRRYAEQVGGRSHGLRDDPFAVRVTTKVQEKFVVSVAVAPLHTRSIYVVPECFAGMHLIESEHAARSIAG